MAEKPKKQSNRKVFVKKALSLVLLGFFAFSPLFVQAAGCKQESSYQQCDIDAISINMDTFTGGTSPDNYARVGADGTLRMTAKVTLGTPASFTVGTDKVNTNTWGSNTVSSFAIGVIPKSQTSSKCHKDSTVSIGAATTFINCEFTFTSNGVTSGRVDAGGTLVSNGFSISGSQFSQLGMTAPATGYTRYSLYIYPYLNYGAINHTQIAFDKSGKEMVVDLYAKQADATAANASGRPTDIPGYGSTSGSATNGEEGGPLWGIVNKLVGFILGIIQEIIYAIFYFLIVPIMQAMLSIRVYTDTFVSVIYPGWLVLRNLCNIIFIVAIMAIAMGTLLRVDAYKSRSVLVQLILSALLVNFSLVIGQIVLGIADTVQSQFLPNNKEVIRALGKDLMVAYRSEVFNMNFGGYFSDIVKQFMFLIMACGSFMVFLAIAAFLFIRMIMLWILLMLSPLAYAAGALPSTSHYRKEWWTTFLKYAFFTPIMAFFLNMTAIISNTYKTNPIFGSLGVKDSDFGDSSLAGFIFRVGSTLLLVVFLIVALKVAESFSIFGASEVTKFAKKGMFAPVGAVKVGAGMAERSYAKNMANAKERAEESGQKNKARALRALQFLSPHTTKEAWKQRQHELEEEAFMGAVGDARDTLNRVMPSEWNNWKNLGKLKLPNLGRRTKYGLIGRRQLINIKKKEWENIPASEEEKVILEAQAIHAEDMEAWNLNLMEGRHEDGRMVARLAKVRQQKEDELFENYKAEGIDERAAKIRAQKEVREKGGEHYVPVEYDAIRDLMDVYKRFEHHGKNAHEMGRIAAHADEEAEGQNKFRQMGFGVWEDHEGAFRLASDFEGYKTLEDQGSLGKLKMLNALHDTGTFTAKDEDYEEVDLHDGSPPQKVLKQVRFNYKDEDGNEQEEVVDSYASLENAIAKTEHFSDESGSNLTYQLTGSRMAGSRQKRIERGNFEDKIKGLEPASMMVMDEHGKFVRFTSSGELTWKKLPAMAATVLAQSRQAQARIMKFVGIYASEDEDKVIDTEEFSSSNPDGVMYNVMAESFALNASAANGIIQKGKLDSALLDQMGTNLQAYYSSDAGKKHFHGKEYKVNKEKDKDGKITGFTIS